MLKVYHNKFSMMGLPPKKILVGILLSAFVVVLGYAFYFDIPPKVDAAAYDVIAMNLVNGKGYVENPDLPMELDFAVGRVGPGYQFFLFLVYALFGHHYFIVWILQALFHIGSAFILFLVARKIFKENGEMLGVIAAFLFVFFVDLFQMAGMLMTESLFIFLVVSAVYLFIRYFEEQNVKNAVGLGAVTALAILTRPTVLFLFLIFLAFALLRKRYKEALIIIACSLFIVGPWVLRNYNVYHRFIGTTAAGGFDLWVGNNPDANGELNFTPEMEKSLKETGIVASDQRGFEEVKNFARSHPFQLIKLQFIKTSIYFSVGRPSAFWFHLHGLSKILTMIFSSLFAFVLFVLGLSGAWTMYKKGDSVFRWLLLMAIAIPLAVIPIAVETRYRFPVYPFLALFSAYFLAIWFASLKKGEYWTAHTKVFLISTLLIVGNTIFDILRNLDVVKDKLGL